MSESVEMYLVMTALSRRAPDQPVAVSHLASRLGVTQVSAIEMCHKLSERGLLHYQPYKGVTLTETGEAQAQAILSRRRLWVIFLVENLGIAPEEADDLACQLEHITSERLVTALKAFLERGPAPRSGWETGRAPEARPLDACAAGTRGQIVALEAPPAAEAFLRAQGLTPGVEAEVQAIGADGAVLLAVEGRPIALAPALAAGITLAAAPATYARQEAWARCSAFWACLRGEARACAPGAPA
ncbi:MAG: metal-dependent transcriptional regulator [Chloroflexaceae bacterium]|nr:metal-dependent transcriptional regulator [Chloroflexaceae bacterium]